MRSSRGFAFLPLLPWIAALAIGAFGIHEYKTVFAPGRNKDGADKAAVAAAVTQAKAEAAKETAAKVVQAVAAVKATHAAEISNRDKIDSNAAGFAEAAKIAIQSDTILTPAEITALGLLDASTQALGQPFTAEQKAFWVKTVGGLLKKDAEAQAKIAEMQRQAAADLSAKAELSSRALAAENTATTLTRQNSEQAKTLAASAAESATLTGEVKAWADREPSWQARIKALIYLVIIVAIIALYILIKLFGVQGAKSKIEEGLKDTVGLVEHVKGIAVQSGHDAAALEKRVEDWYEGDTDAKALYADAKKALRL
jgi:hypothetical protein